jgi:hypothetical protein
MEKNKEQTTLQTLINGLIARKKNIIRNADSMPNDMLEGGVMAFESAIDLAQSLLEMEKEKIINAFWNGDNTDCTSEQNIKDFAQQYYNKTYGDDKK